MERIPRKISRLEPLNVVGTARCAVRAAFSGATIPPATARAGTSQRDVPARFMESFDAPRRMHWDHEPLPWPERGSVSRSTPTVPMRLDRPKTLLRNERLRVTDPRSNRRLMKRRRKNAK